MHKTNITLVAAVFSLMIIMPSVFPLEVEVSSKDINMTQGQHGLMWIRVTNNETQDVLVNVTLPSMSGYETSFTENGVKIVSKRLSPGQSTGTMTIRLMALSLTQDTMSIKIEKINPSSGAVVETINRNVVMNAATPASFDELAPASMAIVFSAAIMIFYVFSKQSVKRDG